MLKQEEALAELDASIDDWVNKLEQAENRRTRVRQKLLEHVAAAATIPASTGDDVVGVSESLQLAMGIKPPSFPGAPDAMSTPPRSPSKPAFAPHCLSGSPSPQRVVAQVPSTILEQPLVEEAAALRFGPIAASAAASRRVDVESIRIYAGDDVYALLADVENEITKMSGGDLTFKDSASLSDSERKKLHRAHSQELLSGRRISPPTSPAHSPASTISLASSTDIFLPSTVFRPEKSVLAI